MGRKRLGPPQIVGATPPRAARPVSLTVREYVLEHVSPDGSAGIVLAVSGGADSLALTVAAADIAQRRGIPYVAAIVDHAMRPESASEADGVCEYLRGLGISQVEILRAKRTSHQRPSEREARLIRHHLLEDYAQTWGAEHDLSKVDILYGHTMDDQAETVLMRLGRGASPRALAAMTERKPVPGRSSPALFRGRPLLHVRRRDTERFCRALHLKWVEDPTNTWEASWTSASGAVLPRTALRHRGLPALHQSLSQDPVPALARVAQILKEDEDALDYFARKLFRQARGTGEQGTLDLLVTILHLEPAAIRKRVYLRAWEEANKETNEVGTEFAVPALSHTQIESIDQLVMNTAQDRHSPIGKTVSLPGGWQVRRTRRSVQFLGPRAKV